MDDQPPTERIDQAAIEAAYLEFIELAYAALVEGACADCSAPAVGWDATYGVESCARCYQHR